MNKNLLVALVATIVGGFTLGFLSLLTYGVLLVDFFANDAASAEPIMWAVALGQFFTAAFLIIILRWKGVGSAKEGFQAGALIGAVMGLANGLMMYGTIENVHTIATLLADAVVSLVVYGIGCAVIAVVLNRGRTEA